METMAAAIAAEGYTVGNVDYDSRSAGVRELAETAVGGSLVSPEAQNASQVHFVTHSLGGILVRIYLSEHEIPNLGNVVMLGPPNQGSEIVDVLREWQLFDWINGPAGRELGTEDDSVPVSLGEVDFSVGIIAGDRSINWINSMMIPGPDDGKVSVVSTEVEGRLDHIVIHATHPFIMNNAEAIRQTLEFLKNGSFDHAETGEE
jgi:hypothetical protein